MSERQMIVGPSIFSLEQSEARAYMEAHAASLDRDGGALLEAASRETIPSVAERLEAASLAQAKRCSEIRYLAAHLAPGPYIMAGVELSGFRSVFAPVTTNVSEYRLSILNPAKPEDQATRRLDHNLIKMTPGLLR